MTPLDYILISIPALINLWAIWHAMMVSKLETIHKVIWVAILIFVPVLGGIAYFFGSYLRQKKV